jgi:TonB family protein
MKLEIKEPCHEDWNKMKIGMISRHCASCEKSVMDFTKMNRAEIITYILSNPNDQVCGRMNRDQFDFHHEDIPILIETLKKQKTPNPFLILALVCLSLTACAQEPQGNISTPPVIETTMGAMAQTPPDTTHTSDTTNIIKDPIDKEIRKGKVKCVPETIELQGEIEPLMGDVAVPLTGGVSIYDPETEPVIVESKALQFAEKMPEFKGGLDALFEFVNKQLKYPNYERKKEIQGNVYVRFVVEKDGSITRPEILNTVEQAKNFDAEVLRVIGKMPNWTPGENNGQKVPVYMTLPITFRLK